MNDVEAAIDDLESKLQIRLPGPYRAFLRSHPSGFRGEELLLYGADEIIERNQTFEIQRFTPELLAVGDDSGGRVVVIRHADLNARPCIVDVGGLTPDMPPKLMRELAQTWQDWQKRGFVISLE